MTNETSTTATLEARVDDILHQFGLDFLIEMIPMVGKREVNVEPNPDEFIAMFESTTAVVEVESDYFGLLNAKTNEIINTVKSGYTVTQNREILLNIMKGIAPYGNKLEVHSAVALNGGRKILVQLKITGDAQVGNDTVEKFITIIDSNDGSTGMGIGIGDRTKSCDNQFFYFYKDSKARFRHSASIKNEVANLPNLIVMALTESDNMINHYKRFVEVPIGDAEKHEMVLRVVGCNQLMSDIEMEDVSTVKKNRMTELYGHIAREVYDKGNNVWGLHSGVTYWTTHYKGAPKRDNGRLESIVIGGNYKTNQVSLEYAIELAS
tara:strand:+ start:4191 stop:5156 length:966 start_codon:yes stop_codon:yes gene_type:complete